MNICIRTYAYEHMDTVGMGDGNVQGYLLFRWIFCSCIFEDWTKKCHPPLPEKSSCRACTTNCVVCAFIGQKLGAYWHGSHSNSSHILHIGMHKHCSRCSDVNLVHGHGFSGWIETIYPHCERILEVGGGGGWI